jgi:PadR family transcriptional regulator, regulatory protein AphA
MSLRHAVLGLLALQPSNGYELTQRFDRSLSNAWHASHSQIYPELARLEAAGMVEVVGEGARRSRTWAVTGAGREELRRWMVETEPHRGQRNESMVRLFLASLLEPDERRAVLERDLRYVDEQAAVLRAVAEQIDATPGATAFRPVVELGLRVDDVMRTWLQEQIEAAS